MQSENRVDAAAVVLFLAVFADVYLRLSAPGTIAVAGLIAFLSLLTSLALLFVRTVDWSACNLPARLAAVLAVALFGLHPATTTALGGAVEANLIAALTGIAAGIVIGQWSPSVWWYRWAALLPAIPCILLHRAGVGFAPLLLSSVWLSGRESDGAVAWRKLLRYWPALMISVLAGFLYREGRFDAGASIASLPGAAASFFLPFAPSLHTGWSTADGLACFAVTAGLVVASVVVFRLPALSFGLLWVLVMAMVAPTDALAAFPGFALATVSVLAAVSTPFLKARPLWLRTES